VKAFSTECTDAKVDLLFETKLAFVIFAFESDSGKI
jgi:hypothetical protein